MEFVIIQLGDYISKERLNCILSIKNKILPEDQFTFISDIDLFHDDKICLIPATKYLEVIRWGNTILDDFLKAFVLPPENLADIIRFHYAALKDDLFYCDTDVLLKERPVFTGNKPCFTFDYDVNVFWTGFGNSNFFNELLYYPIKNEYWKKYYRASFITRLREQKEKIGIVDKNIYEHFELGARGTGL